jgi:hypothetical protein
MNWPARARVTRALLEWLRLQNDGDPDHGDQELRFADPVGDQLKAPVWQEWPSLTDVERALRILWLVE